MVFGTVGERGYMLILNSRSNPGVFPLEYYLFRVSLVLELYLSPEPMIIRHQLKCSIPQTEAVSAALLHGEEASGIFA